MGLLGPTVVLAVVAAVLAAHLGDGLPILQLTVLVGTGFVTSAPAAALLTRAS